MSQFFQDITSGYASDAPLFLPGIALRTKAITIINGDTYEPDLRQAMEHNISINGAAVTIGNPILGGLSVAGWTNLLVTHVRNISGGAITITWGSKFKQSAFTDPTNGNGVITLWHYDRAADLWYSSARQTVAN